MRRHEVPYQVHAHEPATAPGLLLPNDCGRALRPPRGAALIAGVVSLSALAVACPDYATSEETPDASVIDSSAADRSLPATGEDAGARDAASDAAASDDGTTVSNAIPPSCDEAFDESKVVCSASIARPICGSEPGVSGTAPDDLVECDGTTAKCVRHCPHGCVEMPTGHADSCDECFDKDDGYYCVKDLKGTWGSENQGFAVQCQGHETVKKVNCGAAEKCASQCPTPAETNPARPACCIP